MASELLGIPMEVIDSTSEIRLLSSIYIMRYCWFFEIILFLLYSNTFILKDWLVPSTLKWNMMGWFYSPSYPIRSFERVWGYFWVWLATRLSHVFCCQTCLLVLHTHLQLILTSSKQMPPSLNLIVLSRKPCMRGSKFNFLLDMLSPWLQRKNLKRKEDKRIKKLET